MSEKPIHSQQFRLRRLLNWLPLGLAYAFLYMGRYNLTVAKGALGDEVMSKTDFGNIFGVGAIVYGISFIVNGPLTDRLGGRFTMLLGVLGSMVVNVLMGLLLLGQVYWEWSVPVVAAFTLLYAINMYFQSFGAVSIVTVKAPWFHVRERGTFSTIFGIIISLGIYFAFDWGAAIVSATRNVVVTHELGWFARGVQLVLGVGNRGVNENWWLFFIPAIFMGFMWVLMLLFLRNTPGEAGYGNFDTGEDELLPETHAETTARVFWKILTHPILLIVCMVECLSGVLRNGVMHWYVLFAREVDAFKGLVITKHWGLMLLLCGIIGSYLTGWMSDRYFGSRRAPMVGILYLVMFVCTLVMAATLSANPWFVGLSVLGISTAVIGVHGIFSGTVTADFAGKKNTGATVGIVDGFVYLGTAFQSVVLGNITPVKEAAKVAKNWWAWPLFLVPFALAGFFLALKIRHALPKKLQPIQPSETKKLVERRAI